MAFTSITNASDLNTVHDFLFGRGTDAAKAGDAYARLAGAAYGKLAAGVTPEQARQAWAEKFEPEVAAS